MSGCPFRLLLSWRVVAAQQAQRERAHHVPFVGRAAAVVRPRPRGLRRELGGPLDALRREGACSLLPGGGGCRVGPAAAWVAAMVAPPTPVSAMPARITFPALVSRA